MKIKKIHGRQILDSRGNSTIEAEMTMNDGSISRAAVPSGASKDKFEALELRDNDSFTNGKSVQKAIENVNTKIARALVNKNIDDQKSLDQTLINLDGTENKSSLGANAILSVSLSYANAAAIYKKIPLFEYISSLTKKPSSPLLPVPLINIINGGKHANFASDIQEFMILPTVAKNFTQALQMGVEVFHKLGVILKEKGYSTTVGDEGGYAPLLKNGNLEGLELIMKAIEKVGLKPGIDISLSLDLAASEFFENGKYHLKKEGKVLDTKGMINWLEDLVSRYPIISMEDCLDQEDWEGWKNINEKLGDKIQIVGDDLFVTNTKFLEKGIIEKAANTILIKPNQIGTLSETIQAAEMAQEAGWRAIISHRSGETEDTTIAHLAVGLATGQIKTGSVSRGERVCKYNELLRIEEMLGEDVKFADSLLNKKL